MRLTYQTRTGIARIVLFAIAALLFGLVAAPVSAATTVTLESQDWWDKGGLVVP